MNVAMDWATVVSILQKNNLEADLLAFVPVDAACEINCLTLKNNSGVAKKCLFVFRLSLLRETIQCVGCRFD